MEVLSEEKHRLGKKMEKGLLFYFILILGLISATLYLWGVMNESKLLKNLGVVGLLYPVFFFTGVLIKIAILFMRKRIGTNDLRIRYILIPIGLYFLFLTKYDGFGFFMLMAVFILFLWHHWLRYYLAHVAYAIPPVTREVRAANAMVYINTRFSAKQQVFLDFVLSHYVSVGVEELDQEKLTPLLRLKYHDSIADAVADLGRPEEIGLLFAGFQKYLYQPHAFA